MENPPTPPTPLVPAKVPTQLLPEVTRLNVTGAVSGMRIHELALQRLLNRTFFVTEGFPIPVVFSTPGDAFSTFRELSSKGENNPFSYLFSLKDARGNPVYGPYPANIRYPIISVKRLGWQPRITQSYGTRRFRRLAYVSANKDVTQNDLGNVATQAMPTAWDFRFQIDHFARYAETQAIFIQNTMRLFQYMGGAPQVWIEVRYPGVFGRDNRYIHCVLEGNIDDASLEEPGDQPREYRTSYTIKLEGYSPDLDIQLWPTLWKGVFEGGNTLSPQDLDALFTLDFRNGGDNVVFNALPNLPPKT